VGEVNKPGEYHIIANLSVARVLDAAGGLTPDADGLIVVVHFSENPPLRAPTRTELARLIRSGATVPKNVRLVRIPLTNRSELTATLRLEPQDVVYIPSRNEV
jgi:protein involved in polysaccharide export with SLBB domain